MSITHKILILLMEGEGWSPGASRVTKTMSDQLYFQTLVRDAVRWNHVSYEWVYLKSLGSMSTYMEY